jgi:hypothetical protein
MAQLDLSRVWSLSSELGSADWVQVDLDIPSRERVDELLRVSRGPTAPITVKSYQGSRLGDLVGTGWVNLYLASPALQAALKPFTGWSTFAVNDSATNSGLDPHFAGLTIVGRIGPIEEIWDDPAVPGRFGMYVDPQSWDGSDVFVADNRNAIYVTEDVADALMDRQLKNVVLEEVVSLETHPGAN